MLTLSSRWAYIDLNNNNNNNNNNNIIIMMMMMMMMMMMINIILITFHLISFIHSLLNFANRVEFTQQRYTKGRWQGYPKEAKGLGTNH